MSTESDNRVVRMRYVDDRLGRPREVLPARSGPGSRHGVEPGVSLVHLRERERRRLEVVP
jgi:hypothetical protein